MTKSKGDPPEGRRVVEALEGRDECFLHAKDGVGANVIIVANEGVRDDLLVARRGDHEVHMRRTIGMPAEMTEHFADRPVVGNGI